MNDDIEDLFQEAMKALRQQKHRRDNPYVADLIRVLTPCPNGVSRRTVIASLEMLRRDKLLPIPKKFEEAVQSAFNQHTSQSYVFKKRNAPVADDLFYSPHGKGTGIWAVHIDRAAAWLKARETQPHASQSE